MIKVLLLADTHLGFDLPSRPWVEKRRRGPDFFANMRLALEPVLRGEVDLVVHGGDLLEGGLAPGSEEVVRAANLRRLHPPTMTVAVRYVGAHPNTVQ